MALELPVIGTREVGLPELIDADRGRLCRPRTRPPWRWRWPSCSGCPRASAWRWAAPGRAFVEDHCDQRRQAERLLGADRSPDSAWRRRS